MDEVTAEHVLALAKVRSQLLRGTPPTVERPWAVDALGPLMGVVFDADGWRSDATARIHLELDSIVRRWERANPDAESAGALDLADPTARTPYAHDQPSVVAATVRLIWGLSAPEMTATDAARQTGVRHAKENTVRSWPRRMITPDVLRDWGSRVPPAPEMLPTTGPSRSWRRNARRLPPQDPGAPSDDRRRLISRVRRLMALAPAHYADDDIIRVVRRLAAAALRAEYLRQASDTFRREIIHGTLDVWEDEDLPLFRESDRPIANGVRRPPTLRAAATIQMFCFLVTADDERRHAALFAAIDNRSALSRLVSARAHQERMEYRRTALDLPEFPDRTLQIPPAGLHGLTDFYRVLEPSEALKAANGIRGLPNDERLSYIPLYIEKRNRVLQDAVLRDQFSGPRDRKLFALADQSVHLDALNSRHPDLIRETDDIVERDQSASYYLLAPRDRALDLSKSGDFPGAGAAIQNVYHRAVLRRDHGLISDPQEQVETLHQVALAATGILVSTVIDLVAKRVEPVHHASDPLAQYTRAMLNWSALLREYLDGLTDSIGLPDARHADGDHLAWTNWRVTTALTRLRASIAGYTAYWATGGFHFGGYSVSLASVQNAYAYVRELDVLTSASTQTLTMQSTWLAMLDGGLLPGSRSPSRVMAAMPLLNAANRDLRGDPPRFEFRHEASAVQHIRWGDGGDLARIRRGTLAWAYLARIGGNAFTEWYELVEGAGLTAS